MKINKILFDVVVLMFAFLWIYAAVSKLIDFEKFELQLSQSPVLTLMAGFVAWFAPLMEIVIALLLIFSKTRLFGVYASFSLMVFFTGYIIIITRYSDHVPCACGGILDKMDWNTHLIFNAVVAAIAAFALLVSNHNDAVKNYAGEHPK